MSRSRTSALHMGPPQDIVMGPPPLPPQVAAYSSTVSQQQQTQKPKDSQDVEQKYSKLKRKYFELEEKHKDTLLELRNSGERTVKWRSEKAAMLDRILELETNTIANPNAPVPSPAFSAYPRSLLKPRIQKMFIANLDQGILEAESESLDVDPMLMSRHVGPQARKRQEAELREKQEEEAREARRASRRPRGGQKKQQDVQNQIPIAYGPVPGTGGGPHPSPPILVSSTGTRLRLKPPAPPVIDDAGIAVFSSAAHHLEPLGRSESPLSPGAGAGVNSPPPEISPPPIPTPQVAPSQVSAPQALPPQVQVSPPQILSPQAPPSAQVSPPQMPPPETPSQMLPSQVPQEEYAPPPVMPSASMITQGMVTLSPTSVYRATPVDPIKLAQSQMQITLRPSFPPGVTGQRPSDVQRHAKPKRLKAHTVTSKSYSIPMVPRDKKGKPSLPLNVGIMTVISLGEVCMREHFHTERYIFPVGYEVTRRYLSTTDPNAEVVYHCTILDGGDGPKFQIIAGDVPDKPVVAGTATGAWSVIVRAANNIRHRQHSNSVSGPDFFGLGQNTIKHLIQELPGANQLKDYVWQNFVEGGPLGGRHAAVIPALPDEQDPNGATTPNGSSSNGNTNPHMNGAATLYYSDRGELIEIENGQKPKELQIIQVDSEDMQAAANAHANSPAPQAQQTQQSSSGRRGGNNGGPPSNMTTTIKPITFHQEYTKPPQRKEGGRKRERKNSRASNQSTFEEHSPASTSNGNDHASGAGPSGGNIVHLQPPPPPHEVQRSPFSPAEPPSRPSHSPAHSHRPSVSLQAPPPPPPHELSRSALPRMEPRSPTHSPVHSHRPVEHYPPPPSSHQSQRGLPPSSSHSPVPSDRTSSRSPVLHRSERVDRDHEYEYDLEREREREREWEREREREREREHHHRQQQLYSPPHLHHQLPPPPSRSSSHSHSHSLSHSHRDHSNSHSSHPHSQAQSHSRSPYMSPHTSHAHANNSHHHSSHSRNGRDHSREHQSRTYIPPPPPPPLPGSVQLHSPPQPHEAQQVPATFATIMNAYDRAPRSPLSRNGGGHGHSVRGQSPEYAYSGR